MAKKHVKTASQAAPAASAPAAKPALKAPAKSAAPRVSHSRHSRSKVELSTADVSAADVSAANVTLVNAGVSAASPSDPALETILADLESKSPVSEVSAPKAAEDPRAAIEKLAYGYFEARGYQPGNPLEDWVRAEREYYAKKS